MKLMLFAPELILLLGSLLIFFFTLSGDAKKARQTAITIGIAASLICLLSLQQNGSLFYKAYQVDLFSQLFKVLIALAMTVVLIFGGELKDISPRMKPEYYLFLILSGLGLMMLVSSVELITLFVALELSSFSLYLMVPMRDDRQGLRSQMEAGVKYILFAVMATGTMLFGMSYLFGMTGSTYLAEIAPQLKTLMSEPAAIVGIAMILSGFLFKLAVFPFHFWVPDVYQGAANETTSFIASVPKLGAVAILIRITMLAAPEGTAIVTMLMVFAVASMFYGNLAALVQKDIKRLLGFSGIAHAGFVLLGLLTFKQEGYATSIFYIVGYVLMNMACFLVLCTVSKNGENVQIADLNGLYKRSPLMAFTLATGMMALAGIPPFVGFVGKFMLMAGALQAGHLALVILAALNTAIAIYYYLSVLKVTYCDAPSDASALEIGFTTKAVSLALIAAIITIGVNPSPVLEIANRAVAAIL
ncbi:MAG: NADH-quinone oxidoreductase subunit N [Desulfobulbaceae bacterium]|nr:NADH-quinone oxidoreductase subunit N [Desulfobulbaceae bacterium]